MREIKFRSYDMDDKVMRNWEEIDFAKDIGDDYYLIGYKASPVSIRYDHEQMLMQYTGRLDKYSNEIYEHDLVADEVGRIYKVVFAGDCWRCEPLKREYAKNRWISTDLQVIGNIYETEVQHDET